MKYLITILIAFLTTQLLSQDIMATTDSGKRVILKSNGNWEYKTNNETNGSETNTTKNLDFDCSTLVTTETDKFTKRNMWYDTKGNIVFTCSKGLTGVGVDRPIWNTIKDLKAGETYEHTITKSELYYGKKVTYHAPFDKCDRVEDYKLA